MKKTKKGFTLIELLAVIAILAVLAIVAVPSVINMYTNAKQNAFMTQAKSIFKAAEQRFMADQLTSPGAKTYCNSSAGTGDNDLDLSGSQSVYYKIVFNSSGVAQSYSVSDASYSFTKSSAPVLITEVTGTPLAATTITCS